MGYLNSPYFKDIYLYLAQNKLPSLKGAICKVEVLAERYTLLYSLLFKLITIPEKETALLAIPEVCADNIITLYHSSLFVGHQGVIKTYLTIADKFFISDLMHYLCSYIKGCQIPDYIIMDHDSAFMSMLMNYLFKKLNIKIKTVVPYNQQSLQAEHGVKSLSTILTK